MQKPAQPSYARLATAVIVPLVLLLAIFYSTNGDLSSLGAETLRLTAEATPEETAQADGSTRLAVTLKLTNRTGATIQLSANDPCKVLRWVVQAPEDVFVQSKGADCVPEPTSRPIASGETIERSETIALDTRRYKAGVTYTVFAQFYGQTATADFEVKTATAD